MAAAGAHDIYMNMPFLNDKTKRLSYLIFHRPSSVDSEPIHREGDWRNELAVHEQRPRYTDDGSDRRSFTKYS